MTSSAKCAAVLVLLAASSLFSLGQGGPPFLTDDPGTPGNRNWEINLAATSERRPTERVFETPLLDINYGAGTRVQFKFEIPFIARGTDDGPTKSGLGNSLVGLKWRFYDRERGLEISTYPQFEFNNPTASVHRGLVEQGPRLFLPIEVVKRLKRVEVNAEVGYWVSPHTSDEWAAGLLIGRNVTGRLELDGEVYAWARIDGTERATMFDAGGRYKLKPAFILLFMAGRSFRGSSSEEPQFIGYFGIQFLLSSRRHSH